MSKIIDVLKICVPSNITIDELIMTTRMNVTFTIDARELSTTSRAFVEKYLIRLVYLARDTLLDKYDPTNNYKNLKLKLYRRVDERSNVYRDRITKFEFANVFHVSPSIIDKKKSLSSRRRLLRKGQ